MKKTNKLISILLVAVMLLSMAPLSLTASAVGTPSYSTTSEGVRLYANGTNLFIEAGTASGTAVYYMNGSTKTYVNPNGAKGNDLSNSEIYMGTASSNSDYFDVSLVMTGGEVGTIYTGKSYGYLIGKVTVAVTGTAKAGLIWCGSKYGPDNGMDLHGKNGNLAIFDTVGAEILSGSTGFDGMIKNTESGWEISGNAVIPEGVTMIVASSQTVTVPVNAAVENNGALVNNGTLELYGAVTGNSITGNGTINCYADYIENVSTVSSVSAKINGASVTLANGQYRLSGGKLYIWLPEGDAEVTLNSTKYYGIIVKNSPKELTTEYSGVTDISGIPSDITAYVAQALEPKTNTTTFVPEFTYEVLASGTTAAEAKMTGTSLYASGAGTIKLKITASDAYTSYSETFTVTVNDAGYAADIANGDITISKYSDTQLKITHAGFDGGSLIINNDEHLMITGASGTDKNYGIVVENGATANILLKDCSINRNGYNQPVMRFSSGASVNLQLAGENVFTNSNSSHAGDEISNAGIHVPSGASLVIDGEGSLAVTGGENSAGIGGGTYEVSAGTITINGGTVTATGDQAAGIGGSYKGAGGTVTINGGTVTANGGTSSAGIGGGGSGAGGTVTVNGGTVTATGGSDGAGIGGGKSGAGGTVIISDGIVTAKGRGGSAGIGGGYKGAGATVTISGGTVTATGIDGAGIGGGGCAYASHGAAGDGGTVTISGGTVTATGTYGAGIGGGGVDDLLSKYNATAGAGGMITISGGTVVAQSTNSYGGAGIGSGGSRYGTGNSGGTVVITGGNIKATSNGGEAIGKGYNGTDSGTLKNADGNNLTLNTITLNGAAADTAVTKVEGINYGLTDVKTLDTDKLYFWLPADTAATAITAGGNEYFCASTGLNYRTSHDWSNSDGICANCGTNCDHAGQTGESCGICGASLHTHSFTYSASGDTITAVCENTDGNCPDSEGTLTILAPADLYADGTTAKEATIENNLVDTSVAISDITYSAPYGLPPKDAGTYTASVTVGGATASVQFTLLNYAAKVTDKDGNAVGTYKTFAEAVTAAEGSEGSTVTLLDDITLTAEQVIRSGKFTLDLNGKKIISENYYTLYIFENADFTINDSSEGGTIESKEQGYYAVYNYGTLTVESGVIKGDGGIDNIGTLIFKNGKIESGTYSAIRNSDTAYVYNGILESSNESALYNDTDSTLYVYDGELSGNSAISNRGSAYIEGGEFTGNAVVALNLHGGTVEVTGGSFTGTDFSNGYYSGTPYGEWTVCYNEDATLILKGGEFPNGFVVDETTANTFLAEGYHFRDADGKIVEVAEDAKVINGYVKVSKGADLADAVVTVDKTEFVYNGQHQAPAVTVTIGGKTLTENVDYAVNARRWENDVPVQWFYYVDSGVYTSVITGLGDYTGTVKKEFVIKPATVDIIWEGDVFYYTGNPHEVTAKYVDVNGDENPAAITQNKTNTEIGKYIATAVVEDANYTVNGATINHAYEIKWYDGAPDATVSGTKGENGWYTSEVTVTAPEGYAISTLADGIYGSEVTFGNEENAVYYLKQTENGYIAKVELGEIKCDLADPAAEIVIGEYKWNTNATAISFGLFFKETKAFSISASDSESGIAKAEYFVATEKITDFGNIEWIEYTGAVSISPNSKNIIYAKVTDNSGRYVIVNSDGIVLYTDSTLDTSFKDEVVYVLTKNASQSFNLNLNGNTVAYVKIGETVLGTEDYEVLGNMIIVSSDVLENLAAGNYPTTVGVNPLGEAYVDGDAPAEVIIPLTVKKADVTVEISDFGKVYDGKPVTADYKISKSSDSSPAASDIDYNETVEFKAYGADDSTYTTDVPVNAGEYTVRITVAETDKINSAQVTADFTIEKKAVTVTATAPDKVYDGTTDILEYSKVIVEFDGAVEGEMLGFTVGKAWYDTADAGTDKTVHIIYAPVASNIIDNYEFPMNPEYSTDNCYVAAKADITKKAVTVSATVPDRIYGESVNCDTTKVVITFDGIVEGDDVGYVVTDAWYHAHTVTNNAPVQVEYNVNGADADNYQFPEFGEYLAPNYGVQATGRVLPRNIANAEITLGDTLVYNGTEQTQTVAAVTVDGLEVTYTVSGNKATDVGVYELTITGNGNFTGEVTALYEIAPDTTPVDDLTVDNVKSSDKEAIEAVAQQIENAVTDLADNEKKAEYKAITDKCDELLAKIDETAKEIERIENAVNGYDEETVKSSDKADLEQLKADIKALTDGDNLTEDEKAALEEADKAIDELVEKLTEVAEEIKRVDEAVKSYDEETVKSTDSDELAQLKEDIQSIIDSDNVTENEKTALEDMIKDIEGLEDKIDETEEKLEEIKDIENNFNPENVSSDDKAAIEDKIAEIEAVNPDNLTDEQKAEYDEIKAGFEALLEEIAAAEKDVADIGIELETFDEERVTKFWEDDIEALKAKIDELLADENMGETEKAKLNEYKAQAEKLIEIINTPKEYISCRFFYLIWDCLTWKYNGILWLFSKIFGC